MGWNRGTIRKGIHELESGLECVDAFSFRGRKKIEDHLPHLLEDIKAIMDPQSQTDPTFKTTKLYSRLSAEFEDGAVATHDMIGGVARSCRKIHICGTKGEIEGTMEDGWFVIHKPDARAGHEYSETKVEINIAGDMHGGGDMRLVQDFIRVVRDQRPSVSTTDIMDSVRGHQIAYAADYAMNEKRVIDIACDH